MGLGLGLKSIPSLHAGFSIAVGTAVVVDWSLDKTLMNSVPPIFVAMKVNTAVGFVLVGGSLQLLVSTIPAWLSMLSSSSPCSAQVHS